MDSYSQWALNVFKGRIGEAIVESVLSEFGYKVDRIGQEYQSTRQKRIVARQRFAPDLLVIDPTTQNKTYIEVKLRGARPMSVRIDRAKLQRLQRHYPETVLVFVSAYNGSVNCANTSSLSPDDNNLRSDDCYEFDLCSDEWKPIWHYFPLVKPGKRLADLWTRLKECMHSFAQSRILSCKEQLLFEDEREALTEYIEENWDACMLHPSFTCDKQVDNLSLEELWEKALDINAFLFALELCGEQNVGTLEFVKVMDKVRGEVGERYISIGFEEIKETLQLYPDLLARFTEFWKTSSSQIQSHTAPQLLERLYDLLPSGMGKAWLSPEKAPQGEGVEIDIRTVIAMLRRRNCLDARE